MPKPTKGPRLGGTAAHQRLIVSNLATELFEHRRITTTFTRAKVMRPYAEKLITKAKKGDLHNRRQVLKTIHDKSVVHLLFTEIAPQFAERPGGYTRITKIGPRKGDNAAMAVIELVSEPYRPKKRSASPTASPEALDGRDVRRGPIGRPEREGAVQDRTHIVHGESVTPHSDKALDKSRTHSAEDLTLTEHSRGYSVGKTRGFFQHLRNDEYVHAEQQSSGALSVMWSCADSFEGFLESVRKAAPEFFSDDAQAIWWAVDHSGYRVESEDDNGVEYRPAAQLVGHEETEFPTAFCSIRVMGSELVWQAPFQKARWTREPHAQAALMSPDGHSEELDPQRLLSLMSATGTRVVQQVAADWPETLDQALSVVA